MGRGASLNLGGNLRFLGSEKVIKGISKETEVAHLCSSANEKDEIKFPPAKNVFIEFRVSLCPFPLAFLLWK